MWDTQLKWLALWEFFFPLATLFSNVGTYWQQGETAYKKRTIFKSRPFHLHNQTIKEHNRGLRLAPPISLTKQSRLKATRADAMELQRDSDLQDVTTPTRQQVPGVGTRGLAVAAPPGAPTPTAEDTTGLARAPGPALAPSDRLPPTASPGRGPLWPGATLGCDRPQVCEAAGKQTFRGMKHSHWG